MNSNQLFSKITIGILLLITGVFIGVFLLSPKQTQAPTTIDDQVAQNDPVDQVENTPPEEKGPICIGEYCDGSMEADDTSHLTVLDIPLINTASGGDIGCGASLFFAPHTVPQTQRVMNATYEKLFSLAAVSDVPSDMVRNYVATENQLTYESVALNSGIASVYLSGQILASHCAIPSFRAQMEQAALQFETVDRVEFYLNGNIYNWCEKDESGGEGPCPESPQYWIVDKVS